MEKKTQSFCLLLFLFLLISFSVNSAKALVINANGTVDLPDCVVQHDGVYVVTADIDTLTINADNITVDGGGYKIKGGADSAVRMVSVQNATLTNFIITQGLSYLQVGITLQNSVNCTIFNNTISKTRHVNPKFPSTSAIRLTGGGDHTITKNNFTNNVVALTFYESSGNLIFSNNFLNNSNPVFDPNLSMPNQYSLSVNIWDDGSQGNYWTNYNGTGNTPYTINEKNQDNHPQIKPVIIPEFPSWTILPMLMIGVFAAVILKKKI